LPTLSVPEVSERLSACLDDPVVENDERLRLRVLVIKGETDEDLDPSLSQRSWTEALALAQKLGEAGWANRARGELGLVAFLQGDTNTIPTPERVAFYVLGPAKRTYRNATHHIAAHRLNRELKYDALTKTRQPSSDTANRASHFARGYARNLIRCRHVIERRQLHTVCTVVRDLHCGGNWRTRHGTLPRGTPQRC
jgi:hypothetical protein